MSSEDDTGERRLDLESRERVEALEVRYHDFQRRSLIGQAIVGVAVVLALILGGINQQQQSNRSEETRELALQIQTERKRNIGGACRDQNLRNRTTIATLDQLLRRMQADPKVSADRKAQAKTSRQGTVLLIDALAPVQDCADLLQRAVQPSPGEE